MAKLTDIDSQVSGFFKIQSLGSFIRNLFQLILGVAAIATFAYLLWGGVEYITSGGNQERTKSAKEKLTQAIVGFVIVAVTWILWRLITFFLGISPSSQGTFEIRVPQP